MSKVDAQKIKNCLEKMNGKVTMIGDGFVDEVWEIVDTRAGAEDYTIYEQMSRFGQRIVDTGSGGIGLELVKKRPNTFGGLTGNIGYSVARLGADTTLVGVFGDNGLDPSFEVVAQLCEVISVDAPSVTHVFEFNNGKLLMSHMESVLNINWDKIVQVVGLEKMQSLIQRSDIIAVGYWSVLPHFDDILENICKHLPEDGKERRFFFDLADLKKKELDSLKFTLNLLKKLSEKAPMTLSLNEHEAAVIFGLYDETLDDLGRPLQVKLDDVRKKLGLDELVVHDPHFGAAACADEEPAFVKARFCTNVVRSAGAGDNFNGGYVAARLAGLNITERLHVANATVGHFIRTGEYPTVELMIAQMNSTED